MERRFNSYCHPHVDQTWIYLQGLFLCEDIHSSLGLFPRFPLLPRAVKEVPPERLPSQKGNREVKVRKEEGGWCSASVSVGGLWGGQRVTDHPKAKHSNLTSTLKMWGLLTLFL